MITVSPAPIDASAALKVFEAENQSSGAIVSFSGIVRDTAQSASVTALHLQAYEPMTTTGITDATSAAKQRWPLNGLHITHRIGTIAAGETIVFVAAASAHRRAAFEAVDFIMDYLKTRAIFWKKEVRSDGETWIEPRPEDYSDSARWTT